MAVTLLLLLFLFMIITISSAERLRNPYFESPPTNISANATSSLYLLNTTLNAIPGWSFNGTVWYIGSAGPNISLPDNNSHAIQLGQNGKINQTIKARGAYVEFILTFTIAAASPNCANNLTAVNISGHGSSKVFALERRFGWESFAYNLGEWDELEDPINLEIRSVSSNASRNLSCWPVVGTFSVKARGTPLYSYDNKLSNGGFEIGPNFVRNSSEGILLDQIPYDYNGRFWPSPLQDWSITGTVKYIDSRHFAVPKGMAAVELVSGAVKTSPVGLDKGSKYTLEFVLGDSNDSCLGDLVVFLQVGTEIWNFTVQSNGIGSKQNHSVTFESRTDNFDSIPISFASFNETLNRDNVPCGPVIDHVVLSYSVGLKPFRGAIHGFMFGNRLNSAWDHWLIMSFNS